MTDNKKTFYWAAQIFGWLFYFCFILIYNLFGYQLSKVALIFAVLIVVVGISVTHCYRGVIIKLNWLTYPLLKVVPRIIFSGLFLGLVCFCLHNFCTQLFLPEVENFFNYEFAQILQMVLTWSFLIVFWSILYFTAHYFFNYRRQEITNLRLEASQNEIELSNLKSQLNPHFMFNALNGIRALVDEEPEKAKSSITQLSVLLRAALSTGKLKTIKFSEEVELVKNYLALEKMRFEDRLKVSYEISPELKPLNFPPLMLQTVVENAVKHGISQLAEGGWIKIKGELIENLYQISITNSGVYKETEVSLGTGIGLKNTRRRLKLIYGKDAKLHIENRDNAVVTQITIPKL